VTGVSSSPDSAKPDGRPERRLTVAATWREPAAIPVANARAEQELREIEALGGTFSVHSPAGGGTTVCCELPVMAGGQPGRPR
jgi:hypothetical protein